MKMLIVCDVTSDVGGPFKASEVRQETRDARQIADSADTNTDLPVDMRRAEQVEVGVVLYGGPPNYRSN